MLPSGVINDDYSAVIQVELELATSESIDETSSLRHRAVILVYSNNYVLLLQEKLGSV